MGFPSENTSSSEAIRAAHENLRLTAKKAQKTFVTDGSALEGLGDAIIKINQALPG